MVEIVDIIGYAASVLVIAGYIPQIYQGFKTKETKDLSLGMVGLFFVGSILWLAYGIMRKDLPIAFVNAVLIIGQLCLFYLKFKYGGKK